MRPVDLIIEGEGKWEKINNGVVVAIYLEDDSPLLNRNILLPALNELAILYPRIARIEYEIINHKEQLALILTITR